MTRELTGRIRILHLLTTPYAGGAETNLLALLNHFDRNRFEHAVAFGGNGPLAAEFEQAGVPLIRLSERPLCMRSVLEIPAMVRRIRAYGPDVIHSHLDLPNLVALAVKRALGCKLVLHFHGLAIIPRSNLPGRDSKHLFWNVMARFYRYCDKAIAICTFELPFLEKLGMRREQIALIPNGISLEGKQPAKATPDGHYRFVNVGRFFPQKDHALLVRAFAEVSRKLPQARLLLIGDGPLRPEVERQVQEMGLGEKVGFLGIRRDIPDILARCDCFVLNSRWELHPITILEAMRAELPVIASDVGGVADTVADGVTGLLVRFGDQCGLTEAMFALAMEPARGVAMGMAGEKRVAEHFSNALVVRKIESVYEDVLGK